MADALDGLILASIEHAEADAQLRRIAALSACRDLIEAARDGRADDLGPLVTDFAVLTAETIVLEGAIVVTRARLAVSRFVAGIRGRHG